MKIYGIEHAATLSTCSGALPGHTVQCAADQRGGSCEKGRGGHSKVARASATLQRPAQARRCGTWERPARENKKAEWCLAQGDCDEMLIRPDSTRWPHSAATPRCQREKSYPGLGMQR